MLPIHRSAWKMNSRKFTVANGSSTQRQALDDRPCCSPLGPKRPDLVPFVAPLCIEELRLVTVQLPEKCSPMGLGLNRHSPFPNSRKFTFGGQIGLLECKAA